MADNELHLLGNVELKFAMCDTDAQLERCVNLFLAPVLLKVASPHEQVRKKVLEVLTHISKRVKTNPSLKLPFEALLNQLADDNIPGAVKNVALVYLDMAVNRMSAEDTAPHIPRFLHGISQKTSSQRIALLHMILPILNKWTMNPEEQKAARDSVFNFDKNPQDLAVILSFFLDLMLYQPAQQNRTAHTGEQTGDSAVPVEHPGLSRAAIDEVTNNGKVQWTSTKLKEAKLGILHFLLSNVFNDNERLRILIAGSCDSNHEVISISEDGLRRWTNNADLEDPSCVRALYSLYLGAKSTNGNSARPQASTPIKIRVLHYLCKSRAATNIPTFMIQVVFDGLFGPSSNIKLRRSTMAFLQWTARMCNPESIEPVAPVLISGLLKYIGENSEPNNHDAESVKGAAYVAIGLIAKKVPKVAVDDVQLLALLFDNVVNEPPNVRAYVQDALSSMIEIYTKVPENTPFYGELQEIILNAVQKSNSHSRYMALKYANAIFPFSSVFGRYICLLGSSSTISKLEVKEESSRGLSPSYAKASVGYGGKSSAIMPSFKDMIEYIDGHRPSDEYLYESKTPLVRGYPLEVFVEILKLLRLILVLESNPSAIVIDDDLETKVDSGMSEDPIIMENFKQAISSWWSDESLGMQSCLRLWLDFIESSLEQTLKDSILLTVASKCLLEVISLGPPSISSSFTSRLGTLKVLTLSEKEHVRTSISQIFGIIASDHSIIQHDVEDLLSEYCAVVETLNTTRSHGEAIDRAHGAILTIGYLLGRCRYRNRELSGDVVRRCVNVLTQNLKDASTAASSLLSIASCCALAEIGRTHELHLSESLTSSSIIDKLCDLVESSKDRKVQEQAMVALAHLCIPLSGENPSIVRTSEILFKTADTKQVDLYFAGGETFSILGFGWKSLAMQKHKDIGDPALMNISNKSTDEHRQGYFQDILNRIAKTYVTSDRSWYRKASCIWLLSILKFGKDEPLVKANLEVFHACFSRLIADRDDFTQEVASKGLGLVYEYGDPKLKEDMLYSLVSTFTEGRSIQAQSVTDSTVLFEEGALGETPDGSSITTYKELCSLASELNQPDLIYKFMNLANHNALWTSRRGAAFGFQNLMAIAEKELEPYLPRLVPKLYRYQFDPNPRVNQTMKNIWQSLVKDNQKTVDKYFNDIMEDILAGLGNRQWRVREASCMAVTDLVQGRQLSQIEPYLERLWTMSFRALDDIKESVRKAATRTCKTLTNLTVRYCDPNIVSSSDGEKVVDIVMPFLLHKGIVSDAEYVRKFSLEALLRVCKTGASLLKKFVPELIDTLLQSLSSMEPQAMNYLSFHTEKYNITQEQLDNARLSGAKNSPMMEGIDHCVNQIDDTVMQELAPRIINLIKKGTGLPTKAGCARFIVTLCMNCRKTLEPFADAFLKALSGAIRSKNPVIRKSFATATGYVCQLASYDRLNSLAKHLARLYVEDTDSDSHAASAVTVVEVTRFATDRVKAAASNFVPLIYFGEHDPDEDFNKLWKQAWENLTSGTTSMVLLHMDEIIDFARPLLTSSSWQTKQTAALAIADLCKTAGGNIGQHVDKIMPVMISTLSGRSWSGKEHVLEAFTQLCISVPEYFDRNGQELTLSEVTTILIREAKRRNRRYQRHALSSLKTFADAFRDKVDLYSPTQSFLIPLCEMDEAKEMEDEEDENAKPLLLAIKANAFKALLSTFDPKIFHEQAAQAVTIGRLLSTNVQRNVWNVQLAILESMKIFVERMDDTQMNDDIYQDILRACGDHCLGDLKYSAIRTAAVDVLEVTARKRSMNDQMKMKLRNQIKTAVEKEPIAAIQKRLQDMLYTLV